jgi:hypothetical protein
LLHLPMKFEQIEAMARHLVEQHWCTTRAIPIGAAAGSVNGAFMRSLGVRSLAVSCELCRHAARLDVTLSPICLRPILSVGETAIAIPLTARCFMTAGQKPIPTYSR